MKKQDFLIIVLLAIILLPFLPFSFFESFQKNFLFNTDYWVYTSFLKFGLLATIGESIGLRISKGIYNYKGFGLVSRAVVWGLLGIGIGMAFVIFANGTPILLEKSFGLSQISDSMKAPDYLSAKEQGLGFQRIVAAFSISTFMNLIFAPVFMTFHKITDLHIMSHGGKMVSLIRPINFKKIFPEINWEVQWSFVFKKTIPFFWIPAHTITFLLAPEYRIVFAAILGVALGIFLSIAALKSKN
jgi:hypothetical protein